VEGGVVEIVSVSSGTVTAIPLRITDTLYRIGQEAIANSIRHANPTALHISLTFTVGYVQLTITDNGSGFVQGGDLRGFGVRGMRKRAESISSTFQIVSTPHQGTTVQTTAPLPAKITLATWPAFLWSYVRKYGTHVELVERPNPHPHRR
jgi:signal transduction histidine kinase